MISFSITVHEIYSARLSHKFRHRVNPRYTPVTATLPKQSPLSRRAEIQRFYERGSVNDGNFFALSRGLRTTVSRQETHVCDKSDRPHKPLPPLTRKQSFGHRNAINAGPWKVERGLSTAEDARIRSDSGKSPSALQRRNKIGGVRVNLK